MVAYSSDHTSVPQGRKGPVSYVLEAACSDCCVGGYLRFGGDMPGNYLSGVCFVLRLCAHKLSQRQ